MKVVCIIQARQGNTRFPGKSMKEVVGKPLLEHQIERLKPSKYVDEIIVAVPEGKKEWEIIKLCLKLGKPYFVGNEKDVLDRYYQCAKSLKADVIVRATADNPLNDYRMMDKLIKKYVEYKDQVDLVANDIPFSFPIGLNMHVMSFATLEKAHKEATDKFDREHVVTYIINNPAKFRIISIRSRVDLSKERWTVDYPEDYEFMKKVFEALYKEGECFDMQQIMNFLNRNPEVRKLNQHLEHKCKYEVPKKFISPCQPVE